MFRIHSQNVVMGTHIFPLCSGKNTSPSAPPPTAYIPSHYKMPQRAVLKGSLLTRTNYSPSHNKPQELSLNLPGTSIISGLNLPWLCKITHALHNPPIRILLLCLLELVDCHHQNPLCCHSPFQMVAFTSVL